MERPQLQPALGGQPLLCDYGQPTALGFALVPPGERELQLLHRWLDTWAGIGLVVHGMGRQGYDVQLTRYDERGWRATFYMAGIEHSLTACTASAWEPTPWRAVQRAAWEVLDRAVAFS